MSEETNVHEKQLIPADAREQLDNALTQWGNVSEITVSNDQEYEYAIEVCRQVKTCVSDLENKRKELVKPYKDPAAKIDAAYKAVRVPLENGERQLKAAAARYHREQEQKRIEAQRRAEAEAEEKRRKEEERARREREKAAQYAEQGREDLAEKAQARADVHEDRADTIVSEAPAMQTAKPKGVSYRKVYKVSKITDKRKAAEFCLRNPLLADLVEINATALERLMNGAKRKIEIPGLTVIEDYSTAVRTR